MTNRDTYLGRGAPEWAAALRDGDPLVRRLAAYALGEIGPGGGEVASGALAAALNDEETFVRTWAAAALARVEPANPAAVKALMASTSDRLAFVRSLAVWHLGRLEPEAPGLAQAMPAMQRLVDDPDPSVRSEADLAIRRLRIEHCFQAH